MPILIKKIDGSILSYLGGGDADFSGDVIFIRRVVGEVGLEDYFLLSSTIEGFTQNFSSVIDAEFCEIVPNLIGPTNCSSSIELNISY